jgi:hypothetical protein
MKTRPLILVVLFFGCTNPLQETPGLVIYVSSPGKPSRDSMRVKVEVWNEDKVPLDWDRDFSLFLNWDVRYPDGSPVKMVPCDELPEPARELIPRVVRLDPGQTVSRVFDLAKPMKVFRSAHSSKGHVMAYEEWARFVVEEKTDSVMVRVVYDPIGNALTGARLFYKGNLNNFNFGDNIIESNPIGIRLTE